MRWVQLLALILLAAALTGGSFTCRSDNNDKDDDTHVSVSGHF